MCLLLNLKPGLFACLRGISAWIYILISYWCTAFLISSQKIIKPLPLSQLWAGAGEAQHSPRRVLPWELLRTLCSRDFSGSWGWSAALEHQIQRLYHSSNAHCKGINCGFGGDSRHHTHFACDNTECTLTGSCSKTLTSCAAGEMLVFCSVLIRKDKLDFQINSILLADLNSPDLLCMSKLCQHYNTHLMHKV